MSGTPWSTTRRPRTALLPGLRRMARSNRNEESVYCIPDYIGARLGRDQDKVSLWLAWSTNLVCYPGFLILPSRKQIELVTSGFEPDLRLLVNGVMATNRRSSCHTVEKSIRLIAAGRTGNQTSMRFTIRGVPPVAGHLDLLPRKRPGPLWTLERSWRVCRQNNHRWYRLPDLEFLGEEHTNECKKQDRSPDNHQGRGWTRRKCSYGERHCQVIETYSGES